MNQDLQKEFPKVFPKQIYIDAYDGWEELIRNCCQEIEEYLSKNSIPDFQTSCIKTKFGGLRFCTYSSDETIENIIQKYETLSWTTCEECSKPASRKIINNWVWTLCEKCYEERI
jgi:hypothetical protein